MILNPFTLTGDLQGIPQQEGGKDHQGSQNLGNVIRWELNRKTEEKSTREKELTKEWVTDKTRTENVNGPCDIPRQ